VEVAPSVDVAIDSQPGVQIWSLGFAPVNAIGPEFLAALEAAEADESVSVVVVASSLRVFSAGADARWMKQVVEAEGAERLLERFKVTMDRFRDLCVRMRGATSSSSPPSAAMRWQVASSWPPPATSASPPTATASRSALPR
jgi:hypothetical protein